MSELHARAVTGRRRILRGAQATSWRRAQQLAARIDQAVDLAAVGWAVESKTAASGASRADVPRGMRRVLVDGTLTRREGALTSHRAGEVLQR